MLLNQQRYEIQLYSFKVPLRSFIDALFMYPSYPLTPKT